MKKIIVALSVIGLTACKSFTMPDDALDKVSSHETNMMAQRDYANPTPNVVHFNAMYVPVLTEAESKYEDWFYQKNASYWKDRPFSDVMHDIAKMHKINIETRAGIDGKVPIHILVKDKTVGDILDSVASSTGYNYAVSGNNIVWTKYQTEVFRIRVVAGDYDFSIGKKTSEEKTITSLNGVAQAAAVASSGDEYSNVSGQFTPLKDFMSGVEAILGCKSEEESRSSEVESILITKSDIQCDEGASVKALRSDNSLVVRALPSQLDSVRKYISKKTENDTMQVRVNIHLVTVEKEKGSTLNLDVDLVKQLGKASISSVTGSSGSLLAGLSPSGNLTVGYENGSQLAVNALSEQGNILQSRVLRGIAFNNRISQLTNIEKVSFIAKRTLQQTSNVGSTTGIEQETADSGSLLYLLPNIGESDVVLHISSSLSDLKRLTTKGESGNEVESPEISDREVNTMVKLEPGKPVYVSGFSINETQAIFSENGVTGFSRSSNDKEIETIMIVEAEWL